MHRRNVLKLAGVGVAGALAGCLSASGSTEDGTDDGTEELTIGEVEHLEVQETGRETIEVGGTGVVETEPDMATLSVSVEAHDRDDADAVVRELAARSDQLVEDLTDAGIPEENITTTRYSLGESSRRNRYEGQHRFTVEVDDPDEVGTIIDVVADSEADEIRRINFTLSEEKREELYDEAVERAVEDARAEAELFTAAAGTSLGDPVSINAANTGVSPFSRTFSLEATADTDDAAPVTALQQGEVSVSAQATIEYEMHDDE